MRKGLTFFLGAIAITVGVLLIGHLGRHQPEPIAPPWISGKLRVITRPNLLGNPTENSIWPGMEYALLRKLARDMGWEVQFQKANQFPELFDALQGNRAHLAAANLSMTSERLQQYLFTRPFNHTRVVVLLHASSPRLNGWNELPENTVVLEGSIFEKILHTQRVESWRTARVTVLTLLDQIEAQTIDATLLDENVWQLFRPFYPNIRVGLVGEQEIPIGWALPVNATGLQLRNRIDHWLSQAKQSGLLQKLQREYLAVNEDYDPAGTFYFRRLVKERLPRYRHLFQQTAALTGLDWRLLAAIAYQESHWNPHARSRTGVRGMMMLTRATARELGVENRLDSEESVLGAARYLKKLIAKFPERIPYDHRVWFALGAYNVGFRHMENARRLAQKHGADPDDWFAVRPWLARMNELDLVRSIQAWPADGQQAARYVSNIQLYYRFLLWESVRRQKRD